MEEEHLIHPSELSLYQQDDVIYMIHELVEHCVIENNWSSIRHVLEKPHRYFEDYEELYCEVEEQEEN